jgi:hypothetical protein
MTHYPLGHRPIVATPDTTGQNTGNWTAMLDHSVIGAKTPVFECYHLYITTPSTTGSVTATVMVNTGFWDVTLTGQANGWDPAQPILMQPGDTLYILFSIPTSQEPPPTVTAWFRHEV